MFAFFVHNIDPFVIRFHWTFLEGIRWYGVCYAISFLIALFMLNTYTGMKKSPMAREENMSFLTYAILGVLIGGRLGYVAMYTFGELLSNPLSVFAIWKGGMSSHGGFIGVTIAIFLFHRKNKIDMYKIGDMCSSIAPVGIFLGRIANFINGELCGKISNVPWAVIFPYNGIYAANIEQASPRHPSQLYEASLEGIVLFMYVQFRFWYCSKFLPRGQLSGEFLIGYSVLRILVEMYREIDAPLIFWLSRGQFYSIFLFMAGILLIVVARVKHRNRHGEIF